jgi:phosphoglycolate phosphatase-like HAD superfamily hydrolase
MKSIEAIGFDMDYTLAQYKADTFESLAYVGTIEKLVHDLKYPSDVSSLSLTIVSTNCSCHVVKPS